MSLFGKLFHKEQNDLAEREKHTEQNVQAQDGKSFETCNGMICRKMRESV